MTQFPATIRLARLLMFISAALWVIIGVVSLVRLAGAPVAFTPLIVALLMFGGAAVFAVLAAGLGRWRWAYPASLLWMAANIVLTITDDFGAADLLYLLLATLILVLLAAGRSHFRGAGS